MVIDGERKKKCIVEVHRIKKKILQRLKWTDNNVEK